MGGNPLSGNEGIMAEAKRLQSRSIRSGVIMLGQEWDGSLAGAGEEDNQALEAPRAFHPGDNLIPACAGKNHDQATERQAAHALRHTFASHFIQNGGNILTLQKILGHSSLAMTMRSRT